MRIEIIQFDHNVAAGTYGDSLEKWGIECRYLKPDHMEPLQFEQTDGFVLLGGHMGVGDRQKYPLLNRFHELLPNLVEQNKPLLAICLGAQLLADALGGKATAGTRGERSVQAIELTEAGSADPLFAGLPNPFLSFQWHNDSFDLPETAINLASSNVCPAQAFRCRNAYGLQFHPEVNESIIAEWCARARVDDTALNEFRSVREEYQKTSQTILKNFVKML